ncbi:hypothetical protein U1Q18_010241 [Sarracenia purpurea var. burkii]
MERFLVSLARNWHRTPYLGSLDGFWSKALEFNFDVTSPSKSKLIMREPQKNHEGLVPPESVSRFGLEQGDYPYFFTSYEVILFLLIDLAFGLWRFLRTNTILDNYELMVYFQQSRIL